MLNVLVADDSKTMRIQVARVVRDVLPDANVLFAENGAEVLKTWRTGLPPDLTVLDIHMSVLNGLEVMRHASTTGIGVPPVIIYTASRDDVLRQHCLDAGAKAVVTKSHENIHDAIRTVLNLPAESSLSVRIEPGRNA